MTNRYLARINELDDLDDDFKRKANKARKVVKTKTKESSRDFAESQFLDNKRVPNRVKILYHVGVINRRKDKKK